MRILSAPISVKILLLACVGVFLLGWMIPALIGRVASSSTTIPPGCRAEVQLLFAKAVRIMTFNIDIRKRSDGSILGQARTFYNLVIAKVSFPSQADCEAGKGANLWPK